MKVHVREKVEDIEYLKISIFYPYTTLAVWLGLGFQDHVHFP